MEFFWRFATAQSGFLGSLESLTYSDLFRKSAEWNTVEMVVMPTSLSTVTATEAGEAKEKGGRLPS
jgi:hypothetical protein